ncbi:hypothetical protein [Brevibacillus laterosporus]|uniref:hypothetical protein n=1 Tax=Brevibacillus laterosporus TaxID=1465 RepID=UPI00265286B8|nr:hypothetical protein [Brevibacillus laterosporus]MDN9011082.1 hypothetical protein [Brevibacillus laterosporus]MDO0942105.1 hypothetical protein [Brevibacillus laterosporus]
MIKHLAIQGDYPGETIYVSKRVFETIQRKSVITNTKIIDRKIVIEYKAKKGESYGVMELYDIGPAPIKKEKSK